MSWINCVVDDDYEIYNEFPFYIRRKDNKRVVKESIGNNGYVRVHLNCVDYKKHRIVALQFIPNDDQTKMYIDHINHDKTDYHIENLRWVTARENSLNKRSNNGVEYEFVDYDDIPEDLIKVTDYGMHQFEDYYYYSEEENKILFRHRSKLQSITH